MLSLTDGQHVLFGMVCSKLRNDVLNRNLSSNQIYNLCEVIIQFDDPSYHTDCDFTPSESIQEFPERSFEIFSDFWEEYYDRIIESL
jgi:hypothetical protein